MAFNRHHHTPARHHSVLGTGSSHSCLDGVPFKISPIFQLLPQPGLPSELFDGVPRSAFHQEYDYETEEGVLAWAQAREEARIKAQAERDRTVRTRQTLAAAAESSSSSESEDEYGLVTSQTPGGGGVARNKSTAPQQQATRPPWQLLLPASVGNTILTPVPIHTTKSKVQSPLAPKTNVDLALFEQEGDPFDNLELQTIDDMEELRTLLELVSSTEPTHEQPLPAEDAQPMYTNTDMVTSQQGRAGLPAEAQGRSEETSSIDKIYVNVMVRSGMDGATSSSQTVANARAAMARSTDNGSALVRNVDGRSALTRSIDSARCSDVRSALVRSTDSGLAFARSDDDRSALVRSVDERSTLSHNSDNRSALVRSADERSALRRGSDDRAALIRSTDDRSALVQSSDDRSALVRSTDDRSALVRSTGDRSALVRSTDDRSALVRSTDDRSALGRSSGERAALIRSTDDRSALARSSDDRSALTRSSDDRSALVRSFEDRSASIRNAEGTPALAHSTDATSSFDGSNHSSSVHKPDRTSKTSGDFVIEPTGDGDYVMIRSDYSQKSLNSQQDSPSVYANIGSSDSIDQESQEEESQGLYTNSPVFTSSQSSVQHRVKKLSGNNPSESSSEKRSSIVFNPTVTYTLPRTGGHTEVIDNRMTQSAYGWSDASPGAWGLDFEPSSGDGGTKDSHTYTNVPFTESGSVMVASTPAFSNMCYSSEVRSQALSLSMDHVNISADDRPIFSQAVVTKDNHMYSNLPASDVNSIMTASMPAFSDNFYSNFPHHDSDSPSPGNIMSPSGGMLRNARSDFDLTNHSPLPWNPYKPLPPPPMSDRRSSSSSTESLPTEPSQNPSPMVLSPSPGEFGAAAAARLLGEENDPFQRLCSDAKSFVNKLTSMGFSRSRVSRAVEKFGNDEKEVLDHLFNVEKLVEKKFTPSLAEMSLQLYKNDIKKAELFLDLFQQFRELGFASERIQTALVKHELDRDKALDYLTT